MCVHDMSIHRTREPAKIAHLMPYLPFAALGKDVNRDPRRFELFLKRPWRSHNGDVDRHVLADQLGQDRPGSDRLGSAKPGLVLMLGEPQARPGAYNC